MPKTPEVFAKDYAALSRAFDAAALQLKETEQARAQHDQALREAAQPLRQRAAALRAGRPSASADDFKTDAELQRLLGSLDERLARAEADRQRIHGLAVGGWAQALKGAAALDKELAADILARQKLPASKAGPVQIALANLLRLQTDAHKKLAPRRAALLAGQKALLLVDDPQYFRAQYDQARAEALGAPPTPKTVGGTAAPKTAGSTAAPKTAGSTASPRTAGSTAAPKTAGSTAAAKDAGSTAAPKDAGSIGAPKTVGSAAAPKIVGSTAAPKTVGSAPAAKTTVGSLPASPAKTAPANVSPSALEGDGAAASATPALAPANKLLTAAAFKAAGREASNLVAGIRASAGVARRATRAKKPRQAATARATAMRRLSSLNIIVKQYEAARKATGDAVILALPNGRQLLRGIQILVAVRERARAMVNRLAELESPAPRRGPSNLARRR